MRYTFLECQMMRCLVVETLWTGCSDSANYVIAGSSGHT